MDAIARLIAQMDHVGATLDAADPLRYFHDTYTRTTRAVAAAIENGDFVDPEWTERWDVAFAGLYLAALTAWRAGEPTPDPWQRAFAATRGARLPPLRHVLLGINAHVNFDLPRALLVVIDPEEFDDPRIIARRASDHRQIDRVLAARVAAEDAELAKLELPGDRDWLDRLMQPFNRFGVKAFLREARRKVWANAAILNNARRRSPCELEAALARLERLSGRRVGDLIRPRRVIAELTVRGFGVALDGA